MRKSTFNILFYGKKSAVKANGKMPIMGRITVNGQAVQFGAKVEVAPEIWDAKAGKAVGRTQEVIEVLLNSYSTIIFAEKNYGLSKMWKHKSS